jgi:hypothetical protein
MNETILSSIDDTLKAILNELREGGKRAEEMNKKNELESTKLQAQLQGLFTGALSQHAINSGDK